MFWLVILASTLALGLGDADVEPVHESSSVYLQPNRGNFDYRNRQRDHDEHYDHNHDERGPHMRRHPGLSSVEEVIEHVNSPDYYQPTLVLDYRYMKTGGRDYVQGPGGQYLILPPNIHSHQHKKFENFDMLLDHLKQKKYAKQDYH